MLKIKSEKIIIFLLIIIMAYSIMPIVSISVSKYLTTYAYLAILLITFFLLLIFEKGYLLNNLLPLIVPFLFFELMVYIVTKPSIILFAYQTLNSFVAFFAGMYLLKVSSAKSVKVLFIFYLIFYSITAITTIVGLQEYPTAARYLATVGDTSRPDYVKYSFMNIGGYSYVYSGVLVYPAIIYGFKQKKVNIFVLIGFIILELSVIINSSYTIAFLFFVITTLFIFPKRDLKVGDVIVFIIISVSAVLLLFPLFSKGINYLSEIIDNDDISIRLQALAEGKEGLESFEDRRYILYMRSLTSFINHPIFGGLLQDVAVGNHSYILDNVAKYGMFGLVSLISIYLSIYNKFFAVYKKERGYGYVFFTFLQTILLSVFNTGMWLYELTLFLPMIFIYANIDGEEK